MAKIPPIEAFRDVLFDIIAKLEDKDYSSSKHIEFYNDVFSYYWVLNDNMLRELYYYYIDNYHSINESLGKLGIKHQIYNNSEESEEEELDTKILEKLKPITKKKETKPIKKKEKKPKMKIPEKAKEWEQKYKASLKPQDNEIIRKDERKKELPKDPEPKKRNISLKPSKKPKSEIIEKEKPQRNKVTNFKKHLKIKKLY